MKAIINPNTIPVTTAFIIISLVCVSISYHPNTRFSILKHIFIPIINIITKVPINKKGSYFGTIKAV